MHIYTIVGRRLHRETCWRLAGNVVVTGPRRVMTRGTAAKGQSKRYELVKLVQAALAIGGFAAWPQRKRPDRISSYS
jgi:hypothetical protein